MIIHCGYQKIKTCYTLSKKIITCIIKHHSNHLYQEFYKFLGIFIHCILDHDCIKGWQNIKYTANAC